MAILVTGGAGFIGSHFIEHLLARRDEPVVCLDSFNDYYDPRLKRTNVARFSGDARVRVVEGSFCDRRLVDEIFERNEVTHVVHLGAYAGVRYSVENPYPYQQANVEGTLVLLETARRRPVQRFLFASSSTVYGRGAAAPFQEDAPLGLPLSPYGATKRAGELLCLNYHQLHQVPAVCLRFFSVYGPRLRPDLAMSIFTAAIFSGRPLPLFGDGSIRRDFTHYSDVCEGLLAALDRPDAVGECLNLGHNEPIEVRRLISLLEETIGQKAVIDHRPERPEDMPITCADLTKSGRILGYQPKVPFEQGVPEFVDWYRGWYGVGSVSE
jgi:UDP-glucuronate 4-epimerase